MHDLSHYAIEKTLGYKTAFWGLIKNGLHPSVFENKEKRDQLTLSNEAWLTEYMANLILIELTQGEFENINQVLKESSTKHISPFDIPELTKDQINSIRKTYKKLVREFKELAHDGSMNLFF